VPVQSGRRTAHRLHCAVCILHGPLSVGHWAGCRPAGKLPRALHFCRSLPPAAHWLPAGRKTLHLAADMIPQQQATTSNNKQQQATTDWPPESSRLHRVEQSNWIESKWLESNQIRANRRRTEWAGHATSGHAKQSLSRSLCCQPLSSEGPFFLILNCGCTSKTVQRNSPSLPVFCRPQSATPQTTHQRPPPSLASSLWSLASLLLGKRSQIKRANYILIFRLFFALLACNWLARMMPK